MSSVPIYAITTSCRSADCTHRWPYNSPKAKRPPNIPTEQPTAGLKPAANQGRPRSYSSSSDGQTPPTSPAPPVDQTLRSSSLNHLDRPGHTHTQAPKSNLTSQSYRDTERMMDVLGVFN